MYSSSSVYSISAPIKGVAIAAGVSFLLAAATLIWQIIKNKKRYMYTVVATAICESIGYVIWVTSANRNGAWEIFLLLLPPLVLAVASYRTLAHIMRQGDIKGGRRNIRMVEYLFLCFDIIAFLTQASGTGLIVIQSIANIAVGIAIDGLAISVVNFISFTLVVWHVFRAARREQPDLYRLQFRSLFVALFINGICLTLGSIYRVIEYADGFTGALANNDVLFLFFDTLLILICICTWITVPSSKFLPVQASQINSPLFTANDTHVAIGMSNIRQQRFSRGH